MIACALRTRHRGHRTVRSLRPAGLPPAEQMPQLRCAVVLRTPYGGRVRGQAPQHPKGCFFRVFDRIPAINDCVRPAHTTLRTPHSLTRHLLFRRVAPSPGRTGCGTAQNATVARRSVFERGSALFPCGEPLLRPRDSIGLMRLPLGRGCGDEVFKGGKASLRILRRSEPCSAWGRSAEGEEGGMTLSI